MRSIASLEADVVGSLLELLKKEAIPVEVRTTTQESGLDLREIMVEDSYYERACDVAERWEAKRIDEAERRSGRHCPKCGSQHLTYVPLENRVPSYQCKDCGHAFLYRAK
jgi:DNA-directed RNA polymerase subunit M/transcription elongation factor TFIIS